MFCGGKDKDHCVEKNSGGCNVGRDEHKNGARALEAEGCSILMKLEF